MKTDTEARYRQLYDNVLAAARNDFALAALLSRCTGEEVRVHIGRKDYSWGGAIRWYKKGTTEVSSRRRYIGVHTGDSVHQLLCEVLRQVCWWAAQGLCPDPTKVEP